MRDKILAGLDLMEDTAMQRDFSKPEPGFYYHYKHDPAGAVNNYAYFVFGVGHHTEDDCRPEDQFHVGYWPLYEAYVYKLGKLFDSRPYDMFISEVEIAGVKRPRFVRITDERVIAQLKAIMRQMYPHHFIWS